MKKNIDIEQIERYLDGHMEPEEQGAFETLVKQHPELAEEVQFHQNLIKGMKTDQPDVDKAQLKTIWESLKEQEQKQASAAGFRFLRYWYVAAAIAALVVLTNLLFQPSTSNQIVDNSYFEPYPIIVTRTTRISAENLLLTEAKQAYIQEDYATAKVLFDSLSAQAPEEEDLLLYSGISYYQTNEMEEAAQRFQQLLSQSKTWDEHARWYLALSYLEQGKRTQAKVLLQEITSYKRHFNLEKAKGLLNDLKSS